MKLIAVLLTGIILMTGCASETQKVETIIVDGDTVVTKSTEEALVDSIELSDLDPDLVTYMDQQLREARKLIAKYYGALPANNYNAEILDLVFEKWRASTDSAREKPALVVEALGFAFGQDIVNSLDFEWKIIEDAIGKDVTVIHKKYFVNSYPLTSAERAWTENKTGSLKDIKLLLKHNVEEAKKKGFIREH
jgi:hypothetical protein